MRIAILVLSILLTGCKSEKDVVCDLPPMTDGNMEIVNSQCIAMGNSATAFVEIKNKTTNQHFFYTVNWIDDHIIFNLDTTKMINISKVDAANNAAAVAMINSASTRN